MRTSYGPWQFECTLGVGGMGVVHRVGHAHSGALAALKTASNNMHAKRALRREAAALGRLDHPAIVKLIEDGTHETDPWYVMELLEGKTLSALLGVGMKPTDARTWSGPSLDLDSALEASGTHSSDRVETKLETTVPYSLARLAELCHALCHLHAVGLVHCDLKPDNVLVVNHRSVLLDFGLVATRGPRTERGNIIHDARIAGTAAYMSPERVRGDPFDARADLYAIGCMIYRIIAGRPPFEGRSPMQVMSAHREQSPVPLSERVPGLSNELYALVDALLRKEPLARAGHAQRVLHVLARIGVETPDWPLPAHAPLYQPALRGRTHLLERLTKTVRELRGKGSALWLSGESGSGKSRLIAALVARLGGSGPRVLVGGASALQTGANPVAAATPFGLFAEMLGEIAESAGIDPELAALIAQPRARLCAWLPSLGPRATTDDLDTPPDSAIAARHRLYTAVFDIIDAWLGNSPSILFLDDLQWADELSIGALALLLRRIPERPWLVIGLMRTDSDRTHLSDVLLHGEILSLGRLDETDVRAVVCDMLGQEDAPEALLAWVERHAAGNPLLVGECLRAAVADGVLRLTEQGVWSFADADAERLARREAPTVLGAIVAAHLQSLSASALAVLRAAAVIGKSAELSLLSAVLRAPQIAIEDAIDELVHRAIAEPNDEALLFAHDILAEQVYRSIAPAERALLHRSAADALEQQTPERHDIGRIAWHREQAGQLPEAREGYVRAAERALERLALAEAEQHYRDAIRLSPTESRPAPERIAVHRDLVRRVLLAQGRWSEAEQEALAVLEMLGERGRESSDGADILLDLGRSAHKTKQTQAALERFREAEQIATRIGRIDIVAQAISDSGAVLGQLGRFSEAAQLQEEAIARLGPDADPRLSAECELKLATTYNMLGRYSDALVRISRLVEEHVRTGRAHAEASARAARGNVLNYLGRTEEAIAEYRAALAFQRRAGNRPAQGLLLGNWASALVHEGRIPEAEIQYREALAIHRETGDVRNQGVVLCALGGFLVLEGKLEEMLDVCHEAKRLLASIGESLWVAHCDRRIAQVYRFRGQKAEALRYTERAVEAYRRIRTPSELVDALCYFVHIGITFGDPYDDVLNEILALTDGASPDSRLGRARATLERTVAMHRAGELLLAGEAPEVLPEPLQARIYAWGGVTGRPRRDPA